MADMPDVLSAKIESALTDADPAAIARVDQLAAMWRAFYAQRDLDVAHPCVSESSLRALTMTYGFLMARHAVGDLDDRAWLAINDVFAEGATALIVARQHGTENVPAAG